MTYHTEKKSNHMTRIMKLIISLLVFVFDYISMRLRSLLNQDTATCVILYYHAVYPEEAESFTQQMEDLLRWTKPIALNEIGSLKTGGRYCAVTFDDGFVCVRDHALPVLSRRNIPATLFVPSACLGQQAPWLNEEHADYKNVIMTQAQLNNLDKKLVLIGSHGRTHRNLLRLNPDEGRKEIFQSKKELEDILNVTIETISFPEGDFNQVHIDMAIEAGYTNSYSIEPQLIVPGSFTFIRGRVKVDPSDWQLEYRLKLLGTYRWLPEAFLLKRILRSMFKNNSY
jgi:peptidoglycan/xylan/chitin deacetylase (PgdA/CDA1 family)